MNIPESTLATWRAAAGRLHSLILSALAGVRTGQRGVAERRLERAQEEAVRLGQLLGRPGSEDSAGRLRGWDTATNRLYAARLRDAWEAALAVDKERYGPNIGTEGPARVIEILLRAVEDELRGPAWEPFE